MKQSATSPMTSIDFLHEKERAERGQLWRGGVAQGGGLEQTATAAEDGPQIPT